MKSYNEVIRLITDAQFNAPQLNGNCLTLFSLSNQFAVKYKLNNENRVAKTTWENRNSIFDEGDTIIKKYEHMINELSNAATDPKNPNLLSRVYENQTFHFDTLCRIFYACYQQEYAQALIDKNFDIPRQSLEKICQLSEMRLTAIKNASSKFIVPNHMSPKKAETAISHYTKMIDVHSAVHQTLLNELALYSQSAVSSSDPMEESTAPMTDTDSVSSSSLSASVTDCAQLTVRTSVSTDSLETQQLPSSGSSLFSKKRNRSPEELHQLTKEFHETMIEMEQENIASYRQQIAELMEKINRSEEAIEHCKNMEKRAKVVDCGELSLSPIQINNSSNNDDDNSDNFFNFANS